MVIVDEASRCETELLASVRPMLATTNGRFLALTTPAGKRGWFYEAWVGPDDWERITIRATDVPRISPEFLKQELESLGPLIFSQEYETAFIDDSTSVFNSDLIQAALSVDFEPFF